MSLPEFSVTLELVLRSKQPLSEKIGPEQVSVRRCLEEIVRYHDQLDRFSDLNAFTTLPDHSVET